MTLRGRFVPEIPIALFLDVDGTLLEIASSPDTVRVPAALRNTLALAAQREDGALALVSGRTIPDLDRLFAPSVYPAAGQHGLIRRDSRGQLSQAQVDVGALQMARARLAHWATMHPGLLLEDKGMALALHYRRAPALETPAREFLTTLADSVTPPLQLRAGKCVLELLPAGCSKRSAIEAFMDEPPFARRTPVFVGDDFTDEDGFEAVNALGGFSIRVGGEAPSAARYRFASTAGVVAWLRERNTRIMRTGPRSAGTAWRGMH